MLKGQVIRATFSLNLIVALQVEKHCCPFYHLRSQLIMQQILMLRVPAHLENSTLRLVNGVFCVINANKMVDALNFLRKRGIAALVLGLSTDEEGQNHAKETKRFT